jgi:hypothetical protein
MARQRKLKNIKTGEYQATIFWQTGTGIEERQRFAEHAGVKVDQKWAYIYLRDGEEIVKLSRTRNESAQMYVDMSLRQAIKERVTNGAMHMAGLEHLSTYRCAGINTGKTFNCPQHTVEWFEGEIEDRISSLIRDEDWPSVLEQRKIDAAKAQQALELARVAREQAKEAGFGEWRKDGGQWLVCVENRRAGDIVPVRRRDGSVSHHELTVQVSDKLYKVGDEIPANEVESRKTKKLVVFKPSEMPRQTFEDRPKREAAVTPSPTVFSVLDSPKRKAVSKQNRDGSWTFNEVTI